jgi:hypothetical protein
VRIAGGWDVQTRQPVDIHPSSFTANWRKSDQRPRKGHERKLIMRMADCSSRELSLDEFRRLFPKGSFDSCSVPAINGESEDLPAEVLAVSYVVPVQEKSPRPVFHVVMSDDSTQDEYAYLMYAARYDEEFSKGGAYQTVDEAIRAAQDAAMHLASGEPSSE